MISGEKKGYYALLGLSIALSILAVVTMIPNPAAAKPNVLGYRSVCSFAPAATALCGLLAGLTCTIRNRLVSRRAASMRYRPLILPAGIAILFLAVAAIWGTQFVSAQSRFGSVIARTSVGAAPLGALADGTRSATVSEGDIAATVELTVVGGRIGELRLTGAKNVEPALAERLFGAVKAAQSSKIDAVSGATASSLVLLKAVEAAAR